MGAGFCTIRFEKELPSFIQIQTLYYERTGLKLSLKADLHLQKLADSTCETFSLLAKDANTVAKIEKEKQDFFDAHPQQYELLAAYRDEIKKLLY